MTRIGAFTIAFLLVFGSGLIVRWTAEPKVVQPILFNHSVHIENGLDCTDCHHGAESSRRATIPLIEVCADCHEEAMGESKAEALVVASVVESKPIRWRRVGLLPDHVYFSHRRHTKAAEIECTTCHGEMAALTEPPRRALLVETMDDCMLCHKDRDVTEDCNACHR
jgi:hypothetical protein